MYVQVVDSPHQSNFASYTPAKLQEKGPRTVRALKHAVHGHPQTLETVYKRVRRVSKAEFKHAQKVSKL